MTEWKIPVLNDNGEIEDYINVLKTEWKIPVLNDDGEIDNHHINININDRIFVVGANGSGKSALLQNFFMNLGDQTVTNLTGHRMIDFKDDKLSILPGQHVLTRNEITSHGRRNDARWTYPEYDSNLLLISELIENIHTRNSHVSKFVYNKDLKAAEKSAESEKDLVNEINNILNIGSFAISLKFSDGNVLQARKNETEWFSIKQLSDGERNAIQIAISVLLAADESVILIDEPERHLHPSIVRPFLSNLFDSRQDCSFLISTHDITLPLTNVTSKIVLVRSCNWKDNTPSSWDIQVIERESSKEFNKIPDELKIAILGSRERILFVEGKSHSLDKKLYSALFSNISIIPVGSCSEVISSVKTLNKSYDHHHVQAFGLIDKDSRTDSQIKKLMDDKIFAIDYYSVESLYYDKIAINAVAVSNAKLREGCDSSALFEDAISSAIGSLEQSPSTIESLALKKYEQKLRDEVISTIPNRKQIAKSNDVIEISVKNEYEEELSLLKKLIEEKDWNGLVSRYPLRDSYAFPKISEKLFCKDERDYEHLLITQILENKTLADKFRQKLGGLSDRLLSSD